MPTRRLSPCLSPAENKHGLRCKVSKELSLPSPSTGCCLQIPLGGGSSPPQPLRAPQLCAALESWHCSRMSSLGSDTPGQALKPAQKQPFGSPSQVGRYLQAGSQLRIAHQLHSLRSPRRPWSGCVDQPLLRRANHLLFSCRLISEKGRLAAARTPVQWSSKAGEHTAARPRRGAQSGQCCPAGLRGTTRVPSLLGPTW